MAEISLGVKVWGDVGELIKGLNKGGEGVDQFAQKSGGKFAELSRAFQKAGLIYKNVAAEFGPNSPEAKAAMKNFQMLKDKADGITSGMKPKTGMFSSLTGELAGVTAGFLGLTAVAAGVGAFFKGAVEGAMADEKAERKLLFALNDNVAAQHRMLGFKDQMMKTTLFSEDEIMGAMSMGLELGKTEQQTKKMVETAMGLSNVTGQDLNASMLALSATYEGNIGKLGKLSSDVKGLTDAQLANGGAVEILNQKYAKFASSGIDTAAGQVTQFKKAWEEFGDSVGAKVLPVITNLLRGINALGGGAKQSAKEQSDLLALQEKYLKDNAADKGTKGYKGDKYAEMEGKVAIAKAAILRLSIAQLKVDNEAAALKTTQWSVDTSNDAAIIASMEEKIKATKTAAEEEKKAFEERKKNFQTDINLISSLTREIKKGGGYGGGTGAIGASPFDVSTPAPGTMSPVANGAMPGGAIKTTTTDIADAISDATASLQSFGSMFTNVFSAAGNLFVKFKEGFKGGWKEAMNAIGGVVQAGMELVTGLMAQQTQTRITQLDEQYNAQRENIENSKMSEASKKKALDALDKDTEKKRKALMREQAKDQKTAALMQAIVGGALAVVNSFAMGGILGIVMGALMIGLVAAQVAVIASQPLPALASGGLAMAPTMALVGDNPNARIDPEVIAPLSKLRDMIGGDYGGQALTATVKGDDLHFMLQRVARKQARI